MDICLKIKEIKVKEPRDIIIVDIPSGSKIVNPGTRFFCGCCGKLIGVSKRFLKFPFNTTTFGKGMVFQTGSNPCGVGGSFHHKECGHSMFTFRPGWNFISARDYFKKQIIS